MDAFIGTLTSNKILLLIIILSASLLIYSILKRLLKIIVIAIIALAIYLIYMNYTGQEPVGRIQNFFNEGVKGLNKLQQKTEQIDRINDSIKKLQE